MRAFSSAMASLSALFLLLSAVLLLCGGPAATASVSSFFPLSGFPDPGEKRREEEGSVVVVVVVGINRSGVVDRAFSCISSLLPELSTPRALHQFKQVFTPEDEAAVVRSLQALDLSAT
jgi:hypothetical protein